jgi:hypothetical protein
MDEWTDTVVGSIAPDWTNWTRDIGALEATRMALAERLQHLSCPPRARAAAGTCQGLKASSALRRSGSPARGAERRKRCSYDYCFPIATDLIGDRADCCSGGHVPGGGIDGSEDARSWPQRTIMALQLARVATGYAQPTPNRGASAIRPRLGEVRRPRSASPSLSRPSQ